MVRHRIAAYAQASMGPPFENGGGLAPCRAGSARHARLQWGRRSKTAEGVDHAFLLWRHLLASMGPPFENGGGTSICSGRLGRRRLQWGRRSKTAEGRSRR